MIHGLHANKFFASFKPESKYEPLNATTATLVWVKSKEYACIEYLYFFLTFNVYVNSGTPQPSPWPLGPWVILSMTALKDIGRGRVARCAWEDPGYTNTMVATDFMDSKEP